MTATKCLRCPLPAKRGKKRCAVHLAELAEQAKARRAQRVKANRCPECGEARRLLMEVFNGT